MQALVFSALVNGVAAVPLLAALMWAARSRALLGEFTIGPVLWAMGWLTTALMLLAALALLL
jgi:Mn2+/Fe2+ NRAMP family transporter